MHKPIKTAEELKKIEQRVAVARLQELNDIREVMSTPAGRRVMWKLLEQAHVFTNKFTPKSLELYWNCGQRALGLSWYNDILESCKELFWKAQQENIPDLQGADDG